VTDAKPVRPSWGAVGAGAEGVATAIAAWGSLVVMGDADGNINRWDTATGRIVSLATPYVRARPALPCVAGRSVGPGARSAGRAAPAAAGPRPLACWACVLADGPHVFARKLAAAPAPSCRGAVLCMGRSAACATCSVGLGFQALTCAT